MRRCVPGLAVLLAACSLTIDVDERRVATGDAEAGSPDAVPPVADAGDAEVAPPPDGGPLPDARPIDDAAPMKPDARPPPPDAARCVDGDGDDFGDGCPAGPDCDDTDPEVHPGAPERCNQRDDDCDGGDDEELPLGQACTTGIGACESTGHYVCSDPDLVCDAEVIAPSPEICDGLDNDCDRRIDNGARCTARGDCREGGCWAFGRCAGADPVRVVTAGHLIPLDTRGMPDLYEGGCGGGGGAERVMVFELDRAATVHFLTFNATFDAVIYVRRVCDDVRTEVGCDDDVVPGNPNPLVAVDLEAGLYHVFLDGLTGEAGEADFIISVFD